MRLFKANQPHQSEEDRARDARLTNIASRYAAERSLVSGEKATPEPPDAPKALQ
jgi:hypothetical protein